MLHYDPEAMVPWTCTCDYPGLSHTVECPDAKTKEEAVEVLHRAGGLLPYKIIVATPMGNKEIDGHLCINHKLPYGTTVVYRA